MDPPVGVPLAGWMDLQDGEPLPAGWMDPPRATPFVPTLFINGSHASTSPRISPRLSRKERGWIQG